MQINGTAIGSEFYYIYGDDDSISVGLSSEYLDYLDPDTYTFTLVFSDGATVSTDVKVSSYVVTFIDVYFMSSYPSDEAEAAISIPLEEWFGREVYTDGVLDSENTYWSTTSLSYEDKVVTVSLPSIDMVDEWMSSLVGEDWKSIDTYSDIANANRWAIYFKGELVGTYASEAEATVDLSEYITDGESSSFYIYVVPVVASDSPNTGDDFNAAPYVAVVLVSGAVAAVSAVLTYRKKKPAAKAK